MNFRIRNHYWLILAILFLVGCSGNGNPVTPYAISDEFPAPELSAASENYDSHHYLMMSGTIEADISDPDNVRFEVIPNRDSEIHLNILKFVEGPPCWDCFKVVDFYIVAFKVLHVDVQITHPIPNPDLTVFDCRTIMMFEENLDFWSLDKTVPFPDEEHGGLLNPEGYSSLYNPETEFTAPGPLFGYYPGKLATEYMYEPATCNPFRRYISSSPSNTRNALLISGSVVQGFDIQFGFPWLAIGYAVDVSWALPLESPVDDPMTDFGLDANCSEPWKIEVTEDPPGGGIDQSGGETKVIIDVYDWQGSTSHTEPVLECNYMTSGLLQANWVENTDDFSRYEAIISPQYVPSGGFYPCLIAVEDNENDPVNEPWLDQTAYQLYQVRVEGPPIAKGTSESPMQTMETPLHFFDDGSYDADGGDIQLFEWDWDNDGSYDATGADVYNTWDTPGIYYVQFRVTDDEGHTDTLNQPLEITIVEPGIPASPIELTPPYMAFYPYDVAVEGGYAYVAGYDNGLHIFNISNPANPTWVNRVETPGAVFGLEIKDGYAYCAGGYGMYIIDIHSPMSAYIYKTVEGCVAWALDLSDSYAYTVGQNYGMDIIDISDPANAVIVKHVEIQDMAVWVEDIAYDNGYVVIGARFDGVFLYDVDPPQQTHQVSTVYDFMNCVYGVEAEGGYGYISDANNGFRIIDFTTPELPEIISEVMVTGYSMDCAVQGNYAYVAAEDWIGLQIVNIYDKHNAFLENQYETLGYARKLCWDSGYLYIAEGYGGLTVFDVHQAGNEHIVGNAETIGSTMDVVSNNGYAYLADYSAGVRIIDVDPPESAHLVSKFEIYGRALEMEMVGNYLYVASAGGGINILNITSPTSLSLAGTLDMDGSAQAIDVEGTYAYIGNKGEGLQIVDVGNPALPQLINTVETPGEPEAVVYRSGYVYLADRENKALDIIDVNPPQAASIVHTVTLDGYGTGVALHGNYAIVTDDDQGINVVDISNPLSASIVNSVQTYGSGGIDIFGDYAYIDEYYMEAWDISDPMAMFKVSEFPGQGGYNIYIEDNMGYLAAGSRGVRIYQLW